jgi:hypothetical protein
VARTKKKVTKTTTKPAARKPAATKAKPATKSAKKPGMMDANPRVFAYSFASVYPLYVQKVERKGRTTAELDQVICWLTGHDAKSLKQVIEAKADLETFFATAPRFHPNAALIKGVVCGVRVEDIEDATMRKIRYMDKLVDELAQGKAMEKILRA